MGGKIKIDAERCKGCGLCVTACPKKSIALSKKTNKSGYFPAVAGNVDCTGCSFCAIICPDTAIEVYRDEKNIVTTKPGVKKKVNLIRERT